MMGRATEGAIDRAVERLTTYFEISGPSAGPVESAVVALVDSRTAVIDKGASAGLRADDDLDVVRDEPITNAAGEVVFSRRTNVGTATVSEVQAGGALIAVAPGVQVREGDIVVRGAGGSSPSEYLRQGDAFFDAGFYWATIRDYRNARNLDPGAPVDEYRLGVAHLMEGDLDGAFESLSRYLADGGTIEWAATHRHTFGNCNGTFTLTGTTAAYRSPDEDDPDHWFEVPFSGIRQGRHFASGNVAGERRDRAPLPGIPGGQRGTGPEERRRRQELVVPLRLHGRARRAGRSPDEIHVGPLVTLAGWPAADAGYARGRMA